MLIILSKIIYNFLLVFDRILHFLFKREILLKIKNNFEKNSYKNLKINNNNLKFYIPNDLIDWRIQTFFQKEPETLKWINNFERNKDIIFWDIGSNIGLYSIYSAVLHKKIKIFSFEPSTSNLRILSRNVSINNLDDKISIIQLPLSDKENNFSVFHESSFKEGGALNVFSKTYDYKGERIVTENKYNIFGTNISFFLKNKLLKIPNYVKIDVDGIEHLILNGAGDYFKNDKLNSILVEINENFIEQYENIMKFMQENNFELFEKKRADEFYKDTLSNTYNYIFKKKKNL